jgi:hypothetical protein
MEGKRKRGRPCKVWRDEVEEDLNRTWIKTDRQLSETLGNGESLFSKPRSTTDIVLEEKKLPQHDAELHITRPIKQFSCTYVMVTLSITSKYLCFRIIQPIN